MNDVRINEQGGYSNDAGRAREAAVNNAVKLTKPNPNTTNPLLRPTEKGK